MKNMSQISWNERSKITKPYEGPKANPLNLFIIFSIFIDQIVTSWPLMSSPIPLTTIFAMYLLFVYKIGPAFMRNRKPFNLTLVTRIYNVYQILACTAFIILGYQHEMRLEYIWKCFQSPKLRGYVSEMEMRYYYFCWYFIMLRLSELIETVFFILRKKDNQVSVLHVYHHISTIVLLYIYNQYTGSYIEGHTALLNSAVHVIMYSYYLLSSFKVFRPFTNSIKPAITFIQIAQLVAIFVQSVLSILPGCITSPLYYIQVVNIGILILMFVKFYYETFVVEKKKAKKVK